MYGSFLYRPSEAGLAALPPLSENVFSNTRGVDAWIVGTALALLGFVCFAVNLVVTLRNMRAPGMAWRRVPLFSWAAAVSGYLLLVITPVMLAALTMLFIDRHYERRLLRRRRGRARRSSTSTCRGSSSPAPTRWS